MPEMISLRSFRLATLSGHVLQFEAKKPKYVPDEAVSDAMAAGCVMANEEDTPFYEDLSRAKVDFVGDVRKSMLYLAVEEMVKENDVKNFDAGGNPKTQAVSAMLGFEVARAELTDIYQQFQTIKSENGEYALHPAAPNILKVIQAQDRAELVELAAEFGVDKGKAKGLQVRDLRKLLLVKLSGVAAE